MLCRSLCLRLFLLLIPRVGPACARPAQGALPPRALVGEDAKDAGAGEVGGERVRLQSRRGQLAGQEGPLGVAPAYGGSTEIEGALTAVVEAEEDAALWCAMPQLATVLASAVQPPARPPLGQLI